MSKAGLIDCPACGNAVSAAAPQCIHCGHPIAGKRNEQTTGIAALVLMAAVVLSGWLMIKLSFNGYSNFASIGIGCIPTALALIFAQIRRNWL